MAPNPMATPFASPGHEHFRRPSNHPPLFSAMHCVSCRLTPEAPVSSPYCRSTDSVTRPGDSTPSAHAVVMQTRAPAAAAVSKINEDGFIHRLSGIDRPTPGSHSTADWSVFGASSLKSADARPNTPPAPPRGTNSPPPPPRRPYVLQRAIRHDQDLPPTFPLRIQPRRDARCQCCWKKPTHMHALSRTQRNIISVF